MIEKIIDFVMILLHYRFVFVTDFIERCRCKHRYKIL